MPRDKIDEITSTFEEVSAYITSQPGGSLDNLSTTGGVQFEAKVGRTRDGRRYISLPHNNRIYKGDWGYRYNSMGREGQRIGHYSVPIHRSYCKSRQELQQGPEEKVSTMRDSENEDCLSA